MPTLQFAEQQVVTPNPGGQEKFARDWEHYIVAAEGGWFSGKTFIGARKLTTLHAFNAFGRYGEPTYVASCTVAPTYGNALDFCVPELQKALDEMGVVHTWHHRGGLPGGKYSAPAIVIHDFGTRKNPSVILIRSADKASRITGFTVGAAWGDEPARWKEDRHDPLNDSFLQLTGRVRDPRARLIQIILTYTNEGDTTRVYEEMHSGKSDRAIYRLPTKENPHAEDFEQRQRAMLTAELATQYLDGAAASLRGGSVYGAFSSKDNVTDDIEINPNLPIQVSLDFNIRPGMHIEVGQYDPVKDMAFCLYEITGPNWSVVESAGHLVDLLKTVGAITRIGSNENPRWCWPTGPLEVFGDATGSARTSARGESDYQVLMQILNERNVQYKIKVPKANPPVTDRVNAVNCALRDFRGEVHYLIHERCGRLIADLRDMKRDKRGQIDKTEEYYSHPSDAEGYRLHWIRPVRADRVITGEQLKDNRIITG